jgi:hypothetical protein
VKVLAAPVVEVPLGVTTVTSTGPFPGGLTAVIVESDEILNDVALVLPNMTLVAPVKPEPLTRTVVLPAVGPAFGPITYT